jgi:Calcineurin-like phosphoesterase superfamily domain
MTGLSGGARRSRGARRERGSPLKHVLLVLLVLLASIVGGMGMLAVFRLEKELSVGTVEIWVEPFQQGALDLYVPLVDWGVRFPNVDFPARLRLDVRSVNRRTATQLAREGELQVEAVREEAESAIGEYIRLLVIVVFASAVALGVLVALAIRARSAPPVGLLVGAAVVGSVGFALAVALLLPPRGPTGSPEYYAHGPDIPRALQALEGAQRSGLTLSEEIDAQLVGLARLVAVPADRPLVGGLPSLTLASDLHNNLLALPTLERVADGRPLFFAGDLNDRGSPLEIGLTQRIARAGSRFVFVSGNHDSDLSVRRLAQAGATVLTERGRVRPEGGYGDVVVPIAGLRVAGYADPFERRRSEDYRGTDPEITPARQERFARWLEPLVGRVDVVMVHAPALLEQALEELRDDPPRRSLAFLVGHTHESELAQQENVVVLNGGTVGGGGTGNLDEDQPIGVAVLTYRARPRFEPLAADLVEIDPGDGSARAERSRLGLN